MCNRKNSFMMWDWKVVCISVFFTPRWVLLLHYYEEHWIVEISPIWIRKRQYNEMYIFAIWSVNDSYILQSISFMSKLLSKYVIVLMVREEELPKWQDHLVSPTNYSVPTSTAVLSICFPLKKQYWSGTWVWMVERSYNDWSVKTT